MNNPIPILFLFLLLNLYSISISIRFEDLDNKVTMIQERQEQIIQLIEANQ